jgi:general L-amino acid transport system permease protein
VDRRRIDVRAAVPVKLRSAAAQGLALGIAAAALWWVGRNIALTLGDHGISLGFGFLRQPANFEIGDAPVAYDPTDSFARAILVGLANTARVSVLGWVFAIALGFILGILRLSTNPSVRGATRAIVELVRNVPLLLLLLFLAATLQALPPARGALEPVPGVFVSGRGLVVPAVGLGVWQWSLGSILVAVAAAGAMRPAFRRNRAWLVVTVTTAVGLAASFVLDPPVVDRPSLRGFNFVGGISISPELTALLAALVLHHAAHISEVVRGAVLAVSVRQRDAAYALGLSRGQTMRFVVIPQALRAMVPLLATNAVSLTKNSSLAVAIGFPDLVSILNTTANQTGHAIETMLIMIVVYLSLSLLVAAAMNAYNRRLLRPGA